MNGTRTLKISPKPSPQDIRSWKRNALRIKQDTLAIIQGRKGHLCRFNTSQWWCNRDAKVLLKGGMGSSIFKCLQTFYFDLASIQFSSEVFGFFLFLFQGLALSEHSSWRTELRSFLRRSILFLSNASTCLDSSGVLARNCGHYRFWLLKAPISFPYTRYFDLWNCL